MFNPVTASAERIPSEYPQTGTRVRWEYVGSARTRGTVETELTEAAFDNYGLSDGEQSYWFPTLTHARAFCRRVDREIPEVTAELLR